MTEPSLGERDRLAALERFWATLNILGGASFSHEQRGIVASALRSALEGVTLREPGAPITTEGLREAAQRLVDNWRYLNDQSNDFRITVRTEDVKALDAALASAPLPDTEGLHEAAAKLLALLEHVELNFFSDTVSREATAAITALQKAVDATAPLGERNTPESK